MSSINHRKAGTKIVIEGEIEWIAYFDEPSNQWIGICNHLGLTASETSRSELVKSINEATDMMFADLLESGDLERRHL